MPNPSVPPINLLGARTEFGLGAGGNGLLDLLRSPGGVVPGSSRNLGVPTAVPIGLLQLLGTENVNYVMQAASASSSVPSGTASASLQVNADGTVKRNQQGVVTNAFTWLLAGASTSVYAFAELVSGVAPAGSALGVWIQCSTNPSWNLVQSSTGSKSSQIRVYLSSDAATATTSAVWDIFVDRSA